MSTSTLGVDMRISGVPRRRSVGRRGLLAPFFCLVGFFLVASCGPFPITPGVAEYQAGAIVNLPLGASVNAAGGNLMLSRTDMVVKTQVIPFVVGRTYNSANTPFS